MIGSIATWTRCLASLLAALVVTACSRADDEPRRMPPPPPAPAGKQLFFDRALSASGKMACATCHDPDHAHGRPTISRGSSAG
jgi:cytochrome c peroxidase